MRRRGGVIRRDEALGLFPTYLVDDALRAGAITLAHPGVYRLPDADDRATRRRAALAFCPNGALSHTDALDVWRLPNIQSSRVHVTVNKADSQQSASIQIHRRTGYRPEAPWAFICDGLRTVCLDQAIVESWPLLPTLDRRAPAIIAVRERRTTAERLLQTLDMQPMTSGAGAQRRLFGLLAAGNHSELEIWGHERIFSNKDLPISQPQHRVHIGKQLMILDRAFLTEMLAVELDGAAYHGSPGQRERDLKRDSTLARLGWQTVRFSHQRLHREPGHVVDELLDILERRRQQLGIAG